MHQINISFESHRDIARQYRVSTAVISHLARQFKRNPDILAELHTQKQLQLDRKAAVSKVVEDLNKRHVIIDRASQVQELAETLINQSTSLESEKITISDLEVRTVMKDEHGMRYRKILDGALHANSVKNLVLRQRWALEFLTLSRNKKVFLNIDETWLGMSDFRRRKW